MVKTKKTKEQKTIKPNTAEAGNEEDYIVIKDRELILKLRSLGAGVEEADESKVALLEAAYFAERKVLPLDKDELIGRAAKKDPLAKEKYSVLKFLRNRGYIVRPSLDGTPFLRLHRKGLRPGEDKTYYLIEAVANDWKASESELMKLLEVAARLRKELVIAIADTDPKSDGQPTFIKFSRAAFE